jgi:hypothetical protein
MTKDQEQLMKDALTTIRALSARIDLLEGQLAKERSRSPGLSLKNVRQTSTARPGFDSSKLFKGEQAQRDLAKTRILQAAERSYRNQKSACAEARAVAPDRAPRVADETAVVLSRRTGAEGRDLLLETRALIASRF